MYTGTWAALNRHDVLRSGSPEVVPAPAVNVNSCLPSGPRRQASHPVGVPPPPPAGQLLMARNDSHTYGSIVPSPTSRPTHRHTHAQQHANCKGLNTLCVQSAQSRTRWSEVAFLRIVLV